MTTLSMALEARVIIPGVPPNWSNERSHHMVLYARKDQWKQATWYLAQSARNTARWPPPERVREPAPRWVRVDLYRHRLLDQDNAVASIKPILDGLKGVLVWDDAQRWMQLHAVEQHKVATSAEERTVVTVNLVDPRT